MSLEDPIQTPLDVSVCSSLKADAWSGLTGASDFESWHFDAISDDGREALAVDLYDNYALSPRFHILGTHGNVQRVPAVAFAYSVNGHGTLGSVSEFRSDDLRASEQSPDCTIGRSSVSFQTAEYGSGFLITIDLPTFGGRRITAEIEWLLVESDLLPAADIAAEADWNLAVPRADVTGHIKLIGRSGKIRKSIPFRGTGYHDHIKSRGLHYRELSSRMWGRAHFSDATVVFERHGGVQDHAAAGKFFLIRDGEIHERRAECLASEHRRDKWGLMVPRRIAYTSDDNIRIRVKPLSTIRSGLCDVKMLSEITLGLRDGKPRKTVGLTEFIDPRRMKSSVFRMIADMRIGKNGRSPLF